MIALLADSVGTGGFKYWFATCLFVAVMLAIVSEKVHKTKAALFGAAVMIGSTILTQDEAFHSERLGIDYNVVFLLISMMVIVHVIGRSGIFEWAAVRSAKLGRGHPFAIMVIFMWLTAVASAFLDNVTTVLLLAPVTLLIADELDLDAVPFLVAETMASNIGGTATLIGDPPNIIIASRAELTFSDFLVHLAPAVVVMMVGFTAGMWLIFGRRLVVDEDRRLRVLAMDERRLIKDPVLARRSLVVLGLTLVGFILHGALHLEPATVALLGASLLLLISGREPHETLAAVEWPTIFFFIGLFIMVGGIVKVGLITDVSNLVIDYTEPTAEDMSTTAIAVLWASAFLSAAVDNIPYVATMSPLVLDTANTVLMDGAGDPAALPPQILHHDVLMPVWWALALGACLGGNGTPIGASANVIVVGIAERSGIAITFLRFMMYGMPTMIFTVLISHAYIWLRYL